MIDSYGHDGGQGDFFGYDPSYDQGFSSGSYYGNHVGYDNMGYEFDQAQFDNSGNQPHNDPGTDVSQNSKN